MRRSKIPETRPVRRPAPSLPVEGAEAELAYAVELWDMSRTRLEKVVGRAAEPALARAIFLAAEREYPSRLVILRDGENVLETTSKLRS